jgi:HlyD family secretion protein
VIYDVMIDVRNNDLRLKPGMTANLSIIVATRTDTLKIANSALRARVPESLLPPPAPKLGADGKPVPPAKVLTDEERRAQMQELMKDAGFVRGNGPPSPEVIAKMQELAKERGIELPAGRFGNRGDNQPVTRTLYRLLGTDAKSAHVEPVSVKLGITDGVSTEVVDGLKEGDAMITSAVIPGAKTNAAPSANPFSGGQQRRGF